MTVKTTVSSKDIDEAFLQLKDVVKETPLQKDHYLSLKYDCNVYLKREDLQWVRSFKLRGAYNAIIALNENDRQNGITCASAGNHAQGVAYTANKLNLKAVIFMPVTTPLQKINQVKFFGGRNAEVVLTGDTFDDCLKEALTYTENHKMNFIDPFNNIYTIAGQGTLAKEIIEQSAEDDIQFDYLFSAIGGGGLISGVGTYFKAHSPQTSIIGVEPAGASSMYASVVLQNQIVTLPDIDKFVDGASVAKVGEITYDIAKNVVDDYVQVHEGAVCSTILDMYSKQAIIAEPAGALSVTALEQYRSEIKGKTVVCVVSGGNNDINRMKEIEERSLLFEEMKHYFILNFPQRPGALREFVNEVLGPKDDITKFEYLKKSSQNTGTVIIGIQLNNHQDLDNLKSNVDQFDPSNIYINENKMLYSLLI
ncbi:MULTISPECIES: threonine ammonia-lyase IlvA [Staphylococcus]|jgi:threonine dehydratase|uniref:L-threonine dehydratase n=1 Tax=Staphylococcus nepalensis TaxID=214473 RepID=A0A380GJL2_9STAP|nr:MULTISPECIES: threonine ammonia-lyase IlvA [Staphylococcus]VDG66602.1 threonine dehydratase, medium form [Lacrimispora indolis]MBO1206930.1 threonine ammonia-lyase IlvA [Staphylococcus nepalensis]MBO1213004.1 threonine ammonia-lyase IlvA [Staphylococcus nepalensis]MBO1217108.1 threonine ammonia-lyase IlvA [Staphylococcus nepalensis]MBO1222393.1 threonine ammonia-lyase IlvA [Staphylococcus nepalensis]